MKNKHQVVPLPLIVVTLLSVQLSGASHQSASGEQNNRHVREISAELLSRYEAPEDSLKRKAAEYLLAGLPEQWQLDSGNLSGDRLYLIGFSDEDGMKVWSDKMEEMIAMVRG